jgi:gas vesicle protein
LITNPEKFREGENTMCDRNNDLGAFLAGMLIGALVGAATALLLAPQSGEDTRTLIHDKSIELKNQVTDTAEDARARAEAVAVEARARADELAAQARVRAEELRKRGQEVYEEQRGKIETAIKAGKSAVSKMTTAPDDTPAEPAAK